MQTSRGNKRILNKISAKKKSDVSARQWATKQMDALDPQRIGAHLPANEEEYHLAEHHNTLADDTRRRGAGAIQSGGVILRPGGMANYREFHDLYTREPEKKLVAPHKEMVAPSGKYDGPPFRTIAFPETFCILCMRSDVAPSPKECPQNCKCTKCPMLDATTITHSMPEINIEVGDVIRSVICPQCKIDIRTETHQSRQSGIQIAHEGQIMPIHVVKSIARYKKLRSNWEYVLKASRLAKIEGFDGYKTEGIGTA
jgi:hypothetical protein